MAGRITGNQIKDDTLTGDDIDESTLQITLDQVCKVNSTTNSSMYVGNILPETPSNYEIGSSTYEWNKIYAKSLESYSSDSIKLAAYSSNTIKTLQGTSANTAVLEDTTFAGIGTGSFSFSCWFYAQDTNSNPMSTNTKVRFISTSTERHVLDLGFPDVTIKYVNSAGGFSTATYDTNLEIGNWYHIVATFNVSNMSTGTPTLWVNGVEVAGTGFTAPGGTAPNINRATIYLDDGTAMHDAVFWSTVLTSANVSEIYSGGSYKIPSATSISGNIISWFKLGEEADLSSFNPGDTLSGTINLADEIGSNEFTLTGETEFSILSRTITSLVSPGLDINSSSIKIKSSFTPASATDIGQAGTISWDSNYIYVCVAQDTWKRVSIGTW